MQLRYLEEVVLKKATKTKQDNGSYVNTYTEILNYKVQIEELTDAISASIYGATINKMYRISSQLKALETYLKPKINSSDDNLSLYFIEYNNGLYKITSVRNSWIDIVYSEISQRPTPPTPTNPVETTEPVEVENETN